MLEAMSVKQKIQWKSERVGEASLPVFKAGLSKGEKLEILTEKKGETPEAVLERVPSEFARPEC